MDVITEDMNEKTPWTMLFADDPFFMMMIEREIGEGAGDLEIENGECRTQDKQRENGVLTRCERPETHLYE